MSALYFCKRCNSPFVDQVNREVSSLQMAFAMSVFGNGGSPVLNLLKPDATCPICGEPQPLPPGPSRPYFQPLRQSQAHSPDVAQKLIKAAQQETRDYLMRILQSGQKVPGSQYLFPHVVLRFYAFGAAPAQAEPGILCLTLKREAEEILETLAAISGNGLDSPPLEIDGLRLKKAGFFDGLLGKARRPPPIWFDINTVRVQGFEISTGACVVVHFPEPEAVPEVHFAAILLLRDTTRYFTLEYGKNKNGLTITYLAEWHPDRSRHNFGQGPPPNVDDFVECLDRISIVSMGA